jgi:glycerol kinase
MSYIGALDQGTSSTRFIIFSTEGKIVGQWQREHRQILPQAGWVEHDGLEIWNRTEEVIAGALASAGLAGSDLSAIGITNQRETILVWNRSTGLPLAPAIVWQDTRTHQYLESFDESTRETIRGKTGLAIAPYFSASKIHWFIEQIPAVREAITSGDALIGTMDSWILWNLSGGRDGGVHITDVTNASRTMLMNLETLDWDQELLDIFGVPRSSLPTIKSSAEIYGSTRLDGPFKAEVPISGILGDQQGAMVGQTCFDPGDSKTTYGTGNFALLNTGTEIIRSKNGLLTTLCYKFGEEPAIYALEGSVAVTGSAVQWLRDQLGIISSAAEIETLAASVPDNGGVYFVPAFSGLFAPHWRSDARGVIVGLTRAVTKAHIARATLEAIAYQTREVLDAMAEDSGVRLTQMRVDGGITANNLAMQIQSEIMQIDVIRPEISETTALGAAYAAGLGAGIYKNIDELRSHWRESARWRPMIGNSLAIEGFQSWKSAVSRTLNWV